jgi:hypothetical protein
MNNNQFPPHIQKELDEMQAINGPDRTEILNAWQDEECAMSKKHIDEWSQRFEAPDTDGMTFINTARMLMYINANIAMILDIIVSALGVEATDGIKNTIIESLKAMRVETLPSADESDGSAVIQDFASLDANELFPSEPSDALKGYGYD